MISTQSIPVHAGIIMDGNGRWAQARGFPRTKGHKEGLETAKRIVAHGKKSGLKVLSLYVFSTENWSRAQSEVDFLLGLINSHLRSQYAFYKENNIKVIHSGDLDGLPQSVQNEIHLVEKDTMQFDGMMLNLLINYGGRNEISRSIRRLLLEGIDPVNISEDSINAHLDHPKLPPLDLVIRTGGQKRLSNFMIWQSSYAELYFSDKNWPDWTEADFDEAIRFYSSVKRTFGSVTP